MSRHFATLDDAIRFSVQSLMNFGVEIDTGHWQGVPTGGKPDLISEEYIGLTWSAAMPDNLELLQAYVQPNMPWAEEEFLERVGGHPNNPHDSLQYWPWWQGQSDATMTDDLFTHTYSERFWPKRAGDLPVYTSRYGIRYGYGDLNDLLTLLRYQPYTRQAYLPIFFPEDTGAVHHGRIPCTLGYHFLLRSDHLHLWYDIRSCDAVRHFRDDIYLAARLCQWVIAQLSPLDPWVVVKPGNLHFAAHSFHVHRGDRHLL